MLLIPASEFRTFDSREDIDREAQSVVIEAYREASKNGSPTVAFDAALEAYREKFPHIPKSIASQAVACVLATAGP